MSNMWQRASHYLKTQWMLVIVLFSVLYWFRWFVPPEKWPLSQWPPSMFLLLSGQSLISPRPLDLFLSWMPGPIHTPIDLSTLNVHQSYHRHYCHPRAFCHSWRNSIPGPAAGYTQVLVMKVWHSLCLLEKNKNKKTKHSESCQNSQRGLCRRMDEI